MVLTNNVFITPDHFDREDVQLDIFLDIICSKLQINKAREQKLQNAYDNLTDCISNDSFFDRYDSLMYPFGSRALRTVVKPLKKEEYDLDFAIKLHLRPFGITPLEFVKELERCLSNGKNVPKKLKLIRHGVLVVYSGDFHVDIMLGIDESNNRLRVPDWKDNEWVYRNPKGYINWFESKFIADFEDIKLYKYYQQYYPELLKNKMKIEMRTETEAIVPAFETYPEIQPIQRITQLVKRHRDLFFQKNSLKEFRTSSIILTTIIGDTYNKETSIYEGLSNFAESTLKLLNKNKNYFLPLINPADRFTDNQKKEDLTNKWKKDDKYIIAFKEYLQKLDQDWLELHSKNSIRQRAIFLQEIFGESIVNEAYSTLNGYKKQLGINYDLNSLPLRDFETSGKIALANATKNRKPYYSDFE